MDVRVLRVRRLVGILTFPEPDGATPLVIRRETVDIARADLACESFPLRKPGAKCGRVLPAHVHHRMIAILGKIWLLRGLVELMNVR